MKLTKKILCCLLIVIVTSCNNNEEETYTAITPSYPAVEAEFGTSVDLNNLANYSNQTIPSYITKDNSVLNTISDNNLLKPVFLLPNL